MIKRRTIVSIEPKEWKDTEHDYKLFDSEKNLLILPTHTPAGKPIKKFMQWVSGGTDSVLLMYLMMKTIKFYDLDVSYQPLTVRRPRPTNPLHAAAAIEVIEEMFDVELDHLVFYPPIETEEEQVFADGGFFAQTAREMAENDLADCILSGITCNPPIEVQKTFRDGLSSEEELRSPLIERYSEHYAHKTSGPKPFEFYQIDPIINLDKSDVARIYKEEGILDTLFPVTRSCETTESLHEHCGQCWWCEERMWAFGRLV